MATFLPVRRGDPLVRLKLRRRYLPLVLLGAGLLVGGGAVATLGSLYSSTPSSQIALQKGLVGWWKLDGNAKDSSPYRDNGTITGATPAADREGKANSAYSFSGSSQYVTIPYAAAIKPTAAISVSTWVNPSNITGATEQKIISTTETGGYTLLYTGSITDVCAPGQVGFLVRLSNSYRAACAASTLLNNGSWSLITGTYDGSTIKLYINGSLAGSLSFSGPIQYSVNNPVCLGAEPGSATCTAGSYFSGALDDARIYNRALSANEALALYNEYNPSLKAASGEGGLVGWWKLDGDAKDSSPYRNNGTLVASPTLAADRKGQANSAYSFNGTTQYISTGYTQSNVTAFSVSAWIKSSSAGGNQEIWQDRGGGTGHSLSLYMGLGNGTYGGVGKVSFIDDSSSIAIGVTSSSTVNDGQWHHIVGTWAASSGTAIAPSQFAIYIDGQAVTTSNINTGSDTSPLTGNGGGVIGHHNQWTNAFFTGTLDDIRVYKRALAANDVSSIFNSYNSQISVDSYSSKVNLSSGLVGYWNFNGNVNDSTPYRNNGTNNGASLTTDRNSRGNSAYSFNGTTNNINIPGYARLSPGANSFSVSIWLNTTTRADIVNTSDNNQGAFSHGYGLTLSSSSACGATGMVDFEMANGTTRDSILCSTRTLNDGQWHMLTVVVDRTSGNKYVYIDGSLNNSATITISGSVTNSRMAIGQAVWWGNWGGSLDDLRIYNRALSAAEVTSLYSDYR